MLMPLHTLGIKPKGIIHLGACTGEEADDYQKAGVETVIWIDANPYTMAQLHANVDHRPGHYVIEAAVGDNDGETAQFNVANNNASSSLLSLAKHKDFYPDITYVDKIEVIIRHVDKLLSEHGFSYNQFDFVNLDLQGTELMALRGMTECLQYIKWVYTEVNTAELYQGCCLLDEIENFLAKYGFKQVRLAMTSMEWGDSFWSKDQV
jgi:FkbM family methyltransferase